MASFFPELHYQPGDLILDPFMGSVLEDWSGCGSLFPVPLLRYFGNLFAIHVASYSFQGPEFPYRDNWFKPYILKELAYIKGGVENLRGHRKLFSAVLFFHHSASIRGG